MTRHNSSHVLSVGARVYLRSSRRINCVCATLQPWWIGPYEVCEVLEKGRGRLKNLNTGQKLNDIYHGSNLKVYDSHAKTDEDVSTPLPGKRKTENPDETESKRFKPEADIIDTKTTKDSPKSSVGTPERYFSPISAPRRKKLIKRLI